MQDSEPPRLSADSWEYKGNFYTFCSALYGATLGPEAGLAGWSMPGLGNTPQSMLFENTNRPAPGVATLVNALDE